ncbi:hypothetical protein [Rhizobium sp. L51/94]|uniref:hypothetical protein n=1 Tax=Rhizobium sp. L51/94 TaxID=2819999 RepID=UPI001C5A90F6|nr:hypothetical protein [Rhizobium sp. L51/94]QXZ79614.1 hypothetical protein J5274_06420 [Rhizobium sp. L51/94]
MAKKSITIKLGRNGSMTMKSTGGVDLRKIVPHLFETPATEAEKPTPETTVRGNHD